MVSLWLPDKNGNVQDCVLGFDTIDEYDKKRYGSTVGRVGNRIKNAEFSIDGVKTKLD